MENITFQYPSWYALLCILLGLAYALLLYFRDKAFREQSRYLNGFLGLFRFLAVTGIALLLLTPLLKRLITEVKRPVVIMAQDVSESVGAEMDEQEQAAYRQSWEQLRDALGKDYDVKEYAFGSSVREGVDFQFSDKLSNIADMLSTTYSLYSNQNLGAVILATDGIYNEGSNPAYVADKLGAPVYTVALGDTTPKRDLVIKRLFHNRIAYLGDKFSVQADISAENAAGSNSRLSVYKVEGSNSQLLQQFPLSIGANNFFETHEFTLDADKAGVQRYRVVLSEISGEASTANNVKDIFVDVLDARQKILLLANSPHPDLSALRQAISSNKNYDVKVAYINSLKDDVGSYDFVILHQLPSRANDAAGVINTLNQKNISRLFIVGAQTNLARLNQVQGLASIRSGGDNTNEVQARIAPNFGLFKLSENLQNNLINFPPLIAPFGEYDVQGDGQVLLTQRIGKVDTRYPLMVLGQEGKAKAGVLCGEGIWKWRLFDFLQHENHEVFDELATKTVQYLSLKEDKRRFRASLSKNIFNENENIYFDAELYNESFELVNEPDASLVITDSEGKDFSYTFNKSGNAYQLNAGILPTGNYSFRASTNYNGENLTYNGQFSVQPIQLESYETTADHATLRLLSSQYGGQMLFPAEMERIPELIRDKGTVKPVIYQTSKTKPAINLKWIFFLLFGLLAVEWFLRRYFGGY
ncbi:MAG: hypothetical protein KDC66_20080 [Phaeodactylibacter sp.]|nr:hypothetical protein [Phaeodactylibacter sp.]MCB9274442.1 hypothetical protein [Lewinellaceae bacterium]